METQQKSALTVLVMIAVIALATWITLDTVEHPNQLVPTSDNPSPLGYTWSLVLFIIPIGALLVWLFRHPHLPFQKGAFGITLGLLLPLGFVLDLLFAHTFFLFPNTHAVLGIEVPGVGGGIPIEEFIFYLSAFVFVLLLYVFNDEYWLLAYNVPDYEERSQKIKRLVVFHPMSLVIGLLLLGVGIIYKKFFSDVPDGFPGYYAYVLAVAVIPSMGFFKTTSPFINWRAFSLSFFILLLISLLWEASLALPYGWWNYQHEAMMGIFIGAWADLPLEAALVWLMATFTSVIVFEVVKIWRASGRPALHAFLGLGPERK
ncbi:MAG: hypothetical protein COX57_11875 [Alphaproteobacteria bacterium CG_4_10_14_0_2_um_filter_63_37]|nr:MAG: hypothetical protein AUJ55_04920 [Proteobacteria bacterium CG1_02_64_396]PJA23807.1 MAG: hypothetical protein COX57_11875 [Alphaproteobacteria bacterium CG_4_10_14_0_2_um_filter_63_37]